MEKKQTTATWQKKLEITEKNAIAFLGECFRVGGLGWVKMADLETDLDAMALKEALDFVRAMQWLDAPLSIKRGECMITGIGLERLRKNLRYGP